MPKDQSNSKSWINLSDPIPQATALVQETKSYPTSTRRRAKKIRAETAKSQAAAEPEAEETAQDMDISNEHAQPNQKKKGTGKKGKVFATQTSMLSLIDLVAAKEDQKSQEKLKRRAEIEDKAEQRELAVLDAKAKKQNQLELVKEQIKNKRRIQKRDKKRTLKQQNAMTQEKQASSKKKKVGFVL